MTEQPPQVRVVITIEPPAQCWLEGFPDDPVLAYGILKRAEKALDNYFRERANNPAFNPQSRVVKPKLLLVPAELVEGKPGGSA